MNFLNFGKRTLGAVLKLIFRGERPQNGVDAKKVSSDKHPNAVFNSIAESAGYGVLSSGEKNSSIRCQYMNFLNVGKRTLGAVLKLIFRGERSQNGADAMKVSSAVYTSSTRGRKFQADAAFSGRSMVEMLGVLAIIGVLSVGAIGGYQKAMFKYKLNKQAEQLNYLMSILYEYRSQWVFSQLYVPLVPYYKKLKLIPEDMIKDNSDYLYDVFGLKINITTNDCTKGCKSVILYVFINNQNTFEICQNIFNIGKSFSGQLQRFGITKTSSGINSYYGEYHGDKYCLTNKNCLRNLDMDIIYQQCKYCTDSERCNFYFNFYIND